MLYKNVELMAGIPCLKIKLNYRIGFMSYNPPL